MLTTEERRADPERVSGREHLRGGAWSVLVAVAWVVLAAWRPTVTFHLAPVFVAAAWPVGLRGAGPLRVAPVDAARGAVAAALIALATTMALYAADLLRGPTLWDSGPVLAEVLPAVAVGAVGGYRYARCGQPGS